MHRVCIELVEYTEYDFRVQAQSAVFWWSVGNTDPWKLLPVDTPISLLSDQRTFLRQSTRSLLNEQILINERVDLSINALLTSDLVIAQSTEILVFQRMLSLQFDALVTN